MIPRHSAPAPTQIPTMIGRETVEEEPAEEPGKGDDGVEVVDLIVGVAVLLVVVLVVVVGHKGAAETGALSLQQSGL
jgi:hypothetical protein